MKKILFNLTTQVPGVRSGVANYAISLLKEFIDAGDYKIYFRTSLRKNDLPDFFHNKNNVVLIYVDRPKFMIFEVFRQIYGSVWYFCKKNNIHYSINLDPYGAPVATKNNFFVVHDLYFQELKGIYGKRELVTSRLIYFLMNFFCSGVIFISSASKSVYDSTFRLKPNKRRVIHSSLPTTIKNSSSSGDFEFELEKYILIVGNSTPNKKYEILLEIFDEIRDNKFSVLHVGRDIGRVFSGLAGNVYKNLVGVSDDDLCKLYKNAHCLCVTSCSEGFCFPILEAQINGCPVVYSNISAMPEIAGDGGIPFDPNNSSELMNKIILMGDSSVRGAIVEMGYKNVKKFNWKNSYKEYKKFIEEN